MADGDRVFEILVDGYTSNDEFEGVLTTYTPPLDTTSHIEWIVMGQETSTGADNLVWHGHELVRRGSSGNPSIAGTPPTFYDPFSAINPIRSKDSHSFAMDIDVSGTDFRILVTGEASSTIVWRSILKIFHLEQNSSGD